MVVSYEGHLESGRLVLAAEFTSPRDDRWKESVRNIVDDVVRLIQMGGLASTSVPVLETSAIVESSDITEAGLSVDLRGVRIDRRGTTVLHNVFKFIDREVIGVRRLAILWDSPLPPDWLVHAPLPSGYAEPSFELRRESSGDVVDIEIHHAGGVDESEELVRRVGYWFSVVSAGGYDPDFGSPISVPVALDDAPVARPGVARFELVEVRCDEAAFDALINVVQRWHAEVARVTALSIE